MMRRVLARVRSKRALAVLAALACYGAAIVLAPSGVRSQFDAGRVTLEARPSSRPQPPIAAVAPRGDAFAPRAVVDDDRPPAVAIPSPRLVVSAPERPRDRVTAIATGARPTAVIEGAAGTRVVSVGDSLGASAITAIDETTVTLADGERLSLEPGANVP